jgi:hypothetical protein
VAPTAAQVLHEVADELDQEATDFSKVEVLKASDSYYVARVYTPDGEDFTAYHLRRE